MFFLATSHTKNTISEKTLKHAIQLIYPKKRYEHTLFLKVIIIAFTHKNNKNRKNTVVNIMISMWRKHSSLFMFFVCDVARKKHV